MKKLIKLLFIILFFGLLSCTKEVKAPPVNLSPVILPSDSKEYVHGPSLQEAIRSQNEELVIHLLEAGEDYQIYYRDGETPFLLSIQYGLENAAFLMIEKGVDIEEENLKGQGPLYLAWFYQREKIYHYLVERVDLEFLAAVEKGQYDYAKILIKKQADLNQQNTQGNTALMLSIKEGESEFANFLINSGANFQLSNSEGDTALHIAVQYFDLKVIEGLINSGSNTRSKNIYGKSPRKLLKYQIRNCMDPVKRRVALSLYNRM